MAGKKGPRDAYPSSFFLIFAPRCEIATKTSTMAATFLAASVMFAATVRDLVQGIALANSGMSLRAIGEQIEAMKLRTPTGKTNWSPTSVSHLLNKLPPGATPEI